MQQIRFSVLFSGFAGLYAVHLIGASQDLWLGLIGVFCFGCRFLSHRSWRPWANGFLLLVFVVLGVWVRSDFSLLPQALGLALAVLLAQRIWQCRGAADEQVVVLLSLMMLVLSGSQVTELGFFVAIAIWMLATPFVLMPLRRGLASTHAGILAAVAMISVAMFFVLPRFQSPALQPGESHHSVIGFNEEISIGDLSALLSDESPILRLYADVSLGEPLYVRGVSMDHFDGSKWIRTGARVESPNLAAAGGEGVARVTVLAEPGTHGVLFTLGHPTGVQVEEGEVWRDQDDNWFLNGPAGRSRYVVTTRFGSGPKNELGDPRWLQIPENSSARTREAVQRVVGALGETPNEYPHTVRAEALRTWLATNFVYTRTPRDAAPEDPLETFLFERKSGHCEYFASALAIMLRMDGIPARVVNGFLGGEYNETGEYWVIRQSHAHAWVEFLTSQGEWQRLDATPKELAPPVFDRMGSLWKENLEWWWVNHVVAYDRRSQWKLLNEPLWAIENMFVAQPGAVRRSSVPWFGMIAVLLAMGLSAYFLRRLWQRQQRRWMGLSHDEGGVAKAHARAWRAVRAKGWRTPGPMPQLAAADWLVPRAGEVGREYRRLVWLHYEVRYGGVSDTEHMAEAMALSESVCRHVLAPEQTVCADNDTGLHRS